MLSTVSKSSTLRCKCTVLTTVPRPPCAFVCRRRVEGSLPEGAAAPCPAACGAEHADSLHRRGMNSLRRCALVLCAACRQVGSQSPVSTVEANAFRGLDLSNDGGLHMYVWLCVVGVCAVLRAPPVAPAALTGPQCTVSPCECSLARSPVQRDRRLIAPWRPHGHLCQARRNQGGPSHAWCRPLHLQRHETTSKTIEGDSDYDG